MFSTCHLGNFLSIWNYLAFVDSLSSVDSCRSSFDKSKKKHLLTFCTATRWDLTNSAFHPEALKLHNETFTGLWSARTLQTQPERNHSAGSNLGMSQLLSGIFKSPEMTKGDIE